MCLKWLGMLGFTRMHHQKGVYFDGHNRSDVVEYRKSFLTELHELVMAILPTFRREKNRLSESHMMRAHFIQTAINLFSGAMMKAMF